MRLLIMLFLAGAALAQAPSSYKPFGALADVMQSILLPNSDAIFAATRKPPTSEMEWLAVQSSAVALAEVGNVLLLPGRKSETGKRIPVETVEWKKHVQALVTAAKGAYQAAGTKNADAIFVACEPLYQACFSCHEMYRFCPTCPEAPPVPSPGK